MTRHGRATGLILVLLLAAATACTSTQVKNPVPVTTTAGGPVLAFLVDKTIMVADPDGHTTRLATLTSDPEQLLWSPDGKRLAWAGVREGETDSVHIVDVASGAEKSYPCPCRGLGFLGADVATVSGDGGHLLLFPPKGDPVRVTFAKPVTSAYTDPGAVGTASLVAGGRDRVTVSASLDEQKVGIRGMSTLYSVDRRGAITPMLHGKEGASLHEALAAPTGDRIAWLDHPSSGACWAGQRIVDMPYGGGRRVDPAMPADAPLRQAHLPDQRTVLSYSWAGAGIVQTFAPVGGGCQVVYPFRLVSYYREGARWTHLATGLLGIAYGGAGRIAKLVPNPVIEPSTENGHDYTGRLVLSRPGAADKTLAENVGYFAFTPPEAARGRIDPPPLSATPAPSASGPATADDHHAPLSGPLYDAARAVWSAAATGDTDGLARLCHDCDAATLTWLHGDDAAAEIKRLLASHPASGPGRLTYPGLAVSECADAPDSPATCTEEQFADIVALRIPPDVSLDYPGYVYRAPKTTSLTFGNTGGRAVWTGRG